MSAEEIEKHFLFDSMELCEFEFMKRRIRNGEEISWFWVFCEFEFTERPIECRYFRRRRKQKSQMEKPIIISGGFRQRRHFFTQRQKMTLPGWRKKNNFIFWLSFHLACELWMDPNKRLIFHLANVNGPQSKIYPIQNVVWSSYRTKPHITRRRKSHRIFLIVVHLRKN